MDQMVVLNVGGTTFMSSHFNLEKYPETRLGQLSSSMPEYVPEKGYYFFDRNPDLFSTILDFYRNDELHLPSTFCSNLILRELTYWNISQKHVAECCQSIILKDDNVIKTKQKLNLYHDDEVMSAEVVDNCYGKIKRKVWLFLEEPMSSKPAKVYNVLFCIMVAVSMILSLLISDPSIRVPIYDADFINSTSLSKGLFADWSNPKQRLLSTTRMPTWWFCAENTFLLFFSAEFLLRFMACPFSKIYFLKQWINILDILLNVSMWTRVIMHHFYNRIRDNEKLLVVYQICFCFVTLRMVRLARLSKQFDGFRILLTTVTESLKELSLLAITFLMLAVFFANIIYLSEIKETSTFSSAFTGMWWAVITMTTVGYGDNYPKTTMGKIIGSCCAICGIVVMAMPVTIMATNFNNFYNTMREHRNFNARKDKFVRKEDMKKGNYVRPVGFITCTKKNPKYESGKEFTTRGSW